MNFHCTPGSAVDDRPPRRRSPFRRARVQLTGMARGIGEDARLSPAAHLAQVEFPAMREEILVPSDISWWDPHLGLLLSKNGATSDCSSAGAQIFGVEGMTVTSTFQVGFDYRNGGHCGAGAPRFNIDTDMGFFFVGCANAPQTPAPQDPAEWSRTRSVLTTCGSECFPGPVPLGARIKSIDIVFDEGTDMANNDTQGVGLAVVDNIDIDGALITSGAGIADDRR
jgi:hypothetical protein